MITIQGFAKLCGCNTQTLRYYDRIGLLAPAKVDEWTGYRYYEEDQALLFVKIKNLQQADFSIEEIKTLLPGDDDLLMAAFERKIKEQKQKLYKKNDAVCLLLHVRRWKRRREPRRDPWYRLPAPLLLQPWDCRGNPEFRVHRPE